MVNKYKLIKEYPGSRKIGYISDCCTSINSEHYLDGNWFYPALYPEYWEKVVEKDYEVLSLTFTYSCKIKEDIANLQGNGKYAIAGYMEYDERCTRGSELNACLKSGWKINSVKRLSDGEIFGIGDSCNPLGCNNPGKIDKFEFIQNDKLRIQGKNDNGRCWYLSLSTIEKSKTPLFTTEDGVAKFDGDMCYYITPNLISIGYGEVVAGSEFKMALARFHDQYKAKVWVEENKPQFSKKDMISFAGYSRGISGSTTTPKCLEHWLESPYNTKK